MQKSTIRIDRLYAGLDFPPRFITKDKEEIDKILKDAETNPDLYAAYWQAEDNLTTLPCVRILPIQPARKLPFRSDTKLVAIISVSTNNPWNKANGFGLGKFIILLAAILAILFFLAVIWLDTQPTMKELYPCIVYINSDGIAQYTTVEGSLYKYKDGRILSSDRPFINAWHIQRIEDPFQYCRVKVQ